MDAQAVHVFILCLLLFVIGDGFHGGDWGELESVIGTSPTTLKNKHDNIKTTAILAKKTI